MLAALPRASRLRKESSALVCKWGQYGNPCEKHNTYDESLGQLVQAAGRWLCQAGEIQGSLSLHDGALRSLLHILDNGSLLGGMGRGGPGNITSSLLAQPEARLAIISKSKVTWRKHSLGDKVKLDTRSRQSVDTAERAHIVPAALILRLIVDLDDAVVPRATAEVRNDGRGILDLSELVSRRKGFGKLAEEIIRMSRADPGPQDRRNGQGRIKAVQVPVQAANAAGNDCAIILGGMLAIVAQDSCALSVGDLKEVRGFIVSLLPVRGVSSLMAEREGVVQCLLLRLGGRHVDLLVITLSARLDALEERLGGMGEFEGLVVDPFELGQDTTETTPWADGLRGVPVAGADITVPLVRELAAHAEIDAVEVERSRAGLAADEVPDASASRAILVIIVLGTFEFELACIPVCRTRPTAWFGLGGRPGCDGM